MSDLSECVVECLSELSDDDLRTAIWQAMENITESIVAPLVWRFGLVEAERRNIPI